MADAIYLLILKMPMPTTARKAMKMLSRWGWQRRPGPESGESSEGFLARFLGERCMP